MEEKKENDPDLEEDSKIDDKYIIIRKIGQGAFSKVYLTKGVGEKKEKEYAAKILSRSNPPVEINDFLNEIKILKILT